MNNCSHCSALFQFLVEFITEYYQVCQQKLNSEASQCFIIVVEGISSHSEKIQYQSRAQKRTTNVQ